MLHEEEEDLVVRVLAAKMLIRLKDTITFQKLVKIINERKFPFCILAFFILRQEKLAPFHIKPEFPPEKFHQIKDLEKRSFYQACALCCNDLLKYKHWVEDRSLSPLALLIFLDKLGGNTLHCLKTKQKRSFDWNELDPKLIKIMKKGEKSEWREIACSLYWKHRPYVHARHTKQRLLKNLKILEKNFRDPDLSVQVTALKTVTGPYWVSYASQLSKDESKKIRKLLRKYSKERSGKDLTIRAFWALVALSIFQPEEKDKILTLSDSPILLRLGIPIYPLFAHKNVMKNMTALLGVNSPFRKYLNYSFNILKKKKVGKNAKFKQFILIMLPWLKEYSPLRLIPENLKNLIFSCVDDENLHIRQSAITALMWCREKSFIKKLEKIAENSQDKISRKAANTTLSLLYLQYRKHKFFRAFFRRMLKEDESIRYSLAWACNFYIFRKIVKQNFWREIGNFTPQNVDLLGQETRIRFLKKYRNKDEFFRIFHFAQRFLKDTAFHRQRKIYLHQIAIVHFHIAQKIINKKRLREKEKHLQDALHILGEALDIEEKEMQSLRCYLLKAQILYFMKKKQEALESLNSAECIFPEQNVLDLKAKILGELSEQQRDEYYLKAFIAKGKFNILRELILFYLNKNQLEQAKSLYRNFVLQCRHEEFRRLFHDVNNPKWREFLLKKSSR